MLKNVSYKYQNSVESWNLITSQNIHKLINFNFCLIKEKESFKIQKDICYNFIIATFISLREKLKCVKQTRKQSNGSSLL